MSKTETIPSMFPHALSRPLGDYKEIVKICILDENEIIDRYDLHNKVNGYSESFS